MTDTSSQDPGPRAQPEPQTSPNPERKALWMRLLYMVLIAILIGLAQTVLHVMTLVQFIVMLTGKGRPNEQIASFGKSLGAWQAKAAQFQTASSDEKPWPWSPLA